MNDSNGGVAVLTAPVGQPVTGQATPEHAERLGKLRSEVLEAKKAKQKADKAYAEFVAIGNNATNEEELAILRKKSADAHTAWLDSLPEVRIEIGDLPANTRARGGANRQSVVVECFGRVDLNLGKVMSPQDAAKLNRAAWAD